MLGLLLASAVGGSASAARFDVAAVDAAPVGSPAVLEAPAGVTAIATRTPANGRRLHATDRQRNQAQRLHDPIDGVRTDPLRHSDTVTRYDGDGNMLAGTDRKGQAVTKTYDPLNRISSVSYADGSTVSYTWDKGNRLTQVQDSTGGTVTRVYDGLNRVTSETTPQGTVAYTYDAASRRATMTVSGQSQVTYAFDNADRLTQVVQGTATTTIGYDNANRRTSLTLPNGILATYGFDNASELTGITYTSGSTTLGTLSYGYDLAGHVTTRSGSLFQSVLPQAVASASYDLGNRMTARTSGGVSIAPAWDLDGNLTSDGLRTYTWDARNRLTAIQGVASYSYDGFGRRWTNASGGVTKSYLYDGATVVQEQQGGAPSANLLLGLGVDERFTRSSIASGATSTYLTDALHSPVALASAAGSVQTYYGYDPYGVASISGAANDNPYQFTGRENDGTGLSYNRARYYNPAWGRFISEDPIGLSGGINRYAYANGNPISLTDPSGFSPGPDLGQDLALALGIALGIEAAPEAAAAAAAVDLAEGVGAALEGDAIGAALGAAAEAGADAAAAGAGDAAGAAIGDAAAGAADAGAGAAIDAAAGAAGEGAAAAADTAAETAGDAGTTLFRGVASDSPGYGNALNGVANPIGGDATMLEHSLGNTASNFTSWTSNYDTAVGFATNGGTTNGVVLTNTFAPGEAIQVAPNVEAIMGENEFLVPGPVSGASVTGVP